MRNEKLKEKTRESVTAVLPITILVLLLGVFAVPMETGTTALFLTGAVLLIIGMGFFQLGAETAMTPLGEGIGAQLWGNKKIPAIWVALIKQHKIVLGKRRSFGYAVSPFCRSFSKDAGSIPIRS